jgi:hypothetical protein
MPRRYFLVNLALLVIAIFLAFILYKVLSKPLDVPLQSSQKTQRPKTGKSINIEPELHINDYETSVQKDLFRPSRSAAPSEMSSIVPLEKPKLFGTIIMDSGKSAILEDPITKTTKLYNLNDSIAGFVVSDIREDKVILLRGTEKIEVMLREVKGASMLRPPTGPQMPPQRPQPINRPRRVPTPRRPPVPEQPPMPLPEEQPQEPHPFEQELVPVE